MDTSLNVAFGTQISAAAAQHNLDPRLLAAVAAQETGGPGAVSGRNVVGDGGHGHGLFQIDDRWHTFATTSAAMDPAQNADYAAGLLSSNLQKYHGDVRAALTAYNSGSPTGTGTLTDWGDGRPVGYADSVMRHYAALGGAPAPGTVSPVTALTAAADPRDYASAVNGLQSLASQLGSPNAAAPGLSGFASTGLSGSASSAFGSAASTGMPTGGLITPTLPGYHPLQQADGRERDIAPSSELGDDDTD